MDTTGTNQPGLNISFNPMSSGSITATNSSGYTAGNSEDTDPELTYQTSLIPQSYDGGQHVKPYQFNHNSPAAFTHNRMWNSRSNSTNSPGLTSSPSTMNNMVASPRNESQGIHLPSFMNNSIFDAAGQRNSSQNGVPNQFHQIDYSSISAMKANSKDSMTSSPQYSNFGQNASNQLMASYQRKKSSSMNPSISNYTSSMTSSSSFENRSLTSDAKSMISTSGEKSTNSSSYTCPTSFESSDNETVELLRSELAFKNQLNDSLTEKLKSLSFNEEFAQSRDDARIGEQMKIPRNYVQLFRDLTRKLNERTQQLKEAKLKIEAIIVGTVMSKDNSGDYFDSFDTQDIAHRITNKLFVLQTENDALLKMVSHSNKQSLLIEIGLLKSENKVLKERMDKLTSKSPNVPENR